MKGKLGILGVGLLAVLALLAGRIGTTQATGSNLMYIELYHAVASGPGGETCGPLTGIRRVDVIENDVLNILYTNSDGVARYTVDTPTNGEGLTIKYYKTSGALAGETVVIINPNSGTSDPWTFGDGANGGPACGIWALERTAHIKYNPN